MITKAKFTDSFNRFCRMMKRKMRFEDYIRGSIYVPFEEIDFDIEALMVELCKENEVNLAVVDIANVTKAEVNSLPEILKEPTVFLLNNFGDHSKDDLRHHYRQLVRDCVLIPECGDGLCTNTNNFMFAVAVVTKDKPINDGSEMERFAVISE